jgi:phytoene/squalene synthetase
MKFQVDRTFQLFKRGREILKYLPFRLKFQILVTIKGGEAILKKIEKNNFNVLEKRPTLSKFDFARIFVSTIFLWR